MDADDSDIDRETDTIRILADPRAAALKGIASKPTPRRTPALPVIYSSASPIYARFKLFFLQRGAIHICASSAPPAPPGFIYDTFCFTCALLISSCYRFLLIIRLYEFIYVTVCSLQCQYQLGHRLTSLRLGGPRSPLLLQLLQPLT